MKRFKEFLVEKLDKKYVVIYSGRFQPAHKGHYETFMNVVNKFGKDNVYIGTSDKVEMPKSPFNFKEKKEIMTTMFNIPKKKIIQVKNPYAPSEILGMFEESTSYITVVGKKDADRLMKGKYFELYKDNMDMEGYMDKGYIFIAPENTTLHNGKQVSGTMVRDTFKMSEEEDKESLFVSLYGKMNKKIFKLITGRIK